MARKVAGRGGARTSARKTARKGASRPAARKVARKAAVRKAAPKRARSNRSDYRSKQQVAKVEAPASTNPAAQQGDCLSRLFLIALPFILVGLFLILRPT